MDVDEALYRWKGQIADLKDGRQRCLSSKLSALSESEGVTALQGCSILPYSFNRLVLSHYNSLIPSKCAKELPSSKNPKTQLIQNV